MREIVLLLGEESDGTGGGELFAEEGNICRGEESI
jgi:hypothetical protein